MAVTYGVIVYQEQLIEIGRLANLKNPDELRQATAKKKPKLMAKIEPELKNGLMQRGWSQEQADNLWEDILAFAKYSFNKSHSQAYAITAYISMYMKVHYPYEYITAYINSYDGDVKNIAKVLQEAIRMNLQFKFDNWKSIKPTTTLDNNIILLGINTLKGFGCNVSKALNEVGNRIHTSFLDLIIDLESNQNIDKSQIMTLTQLNLFNEYGENGKLEKIYKLYSNVYNRKQFDKGKLPIDETILKKYAKETEKQYRNIDTKGLFNELCMSLEDKKISLKRQLNLIFEYQGIISYTNSNLINFAYVLQTDVKYSPKVRLYYLNDGTCETCKISKKIYVCNPIDAGDIIQITKSSRQNKRIWNESIQDYDIIQDEYDTWINSYIKR